MTRRKGPNNYIRVSKILGVNLRDEKTIFFDDTDTADVTRAALETAREIEVRGGDIDRVAAGTDRLVDAVLWRRCPGFPYRDIVGVPQRLASRQRPGAQADE